MIVRDRYLFYRLLTLSLIMAFLVSGTPPVKAQGNKGWSWMTPDLDGDGLPNEIERGGWCNALGCFQTDELDPDSDDDGLTDGEEKLFESDPTSDSSPGIYIIYEDIFKTRKYYPWQPYGHKLIARGDEFDPPRPDQIDIQKNHGNDLDAAVVRRGTTFYVGGPVNATLQISKSKSSLTTLSTTRDPFTGHWRVTVPSTGTVGKYTLTMDGHSLDLFVIFQLPSPSGELTQKGITKFVYDDSPTATRDALSVLLGDARYDYPYGFVAEGGSYSFRNQQYNRFILENYVIEAINGATSQRDAADALADKVDQLTVFRNPRVLYDSWTVLNPGVNPRQQCSNIAGLLTAFDRAAGIPARPVMVDWAVNSFDHANEVWLSNQWRVYRGYKTFEMGTYPDDSHKGCGTATWPACGTYKYYTRATWGKSIYIPWHSGGGGGGNVIVLADDNWTTTGWGVAYRWPSWQVDTIMLDTKRLMTQLTEYWSYWGWTAEPQNIGLPGWPPPPPGATGAGDMTSQSVGFQSPQVQLGNIAKEYRIDLNGNGQYDQLVLELEVTATQPGDYWLLGQLGTPQPEPALVGVGGLVAQAWTPIHLSAGSQIIQLTFEGQEISLKRVNGPYVLQGIWITDVKDPGLTEFMNDSLAYRGYLHTTAPYMAAEFETYGALLSGTYSHYDLDSNGDGRSDALIVQTGIQVYQPGTFTVQGSLYDNQDRFIAQATWTGTGPEVALHFAPVAGTVGPYKLRDLQLLDSSAQSIDYIAEAYTIAPVPALANPDIASLDILPVGAGELMALGEAITPTQVFNESLVDGDLRVEAEVQVSKAGSYKLEAWLADAGGDLVTWSQGQPANLSPGKHVLSLTFEGGNIRARGIAGPYQVVALKVLNAEKPYQVLDNVDIALTTQAYSLDQFTGNRENLLEDFVEDGGSRWIPKSPWAISQGSSFSPSHAWYGTDANASLTLAVPLNLLDLWTTGIRFQTAYKFGASGEFGYVEASLDGVNWDTLAVFSGESPWSTQVLDLSDYANQESIHLRFRLASDGGITNDGWYIDDILVAALPEHSVFLPIISK